MKLEYFLLYIATEKPHPLPKTRQERCILKGLIFLWSKVALSLKPISTIIIFTNHGTPKVYSE